MRYNSYEEMLESQATDPSYYTCDDCGGLRHEGIAGMWVWWGTREIWKKCESCGGSGVLSPREVGEV